MTNEQQQVAAVDDSLNKDVPMIRYPSPYVLIITHIYQYVKLY